jgi:hypothetical protein
MKPGAPEVYVVAFRGGQGKWQVSTNEGVEPQWSRDGEAPNGEFFVAVFAGTVNTKMYKIKPKHQSKLGLN